MILVVSSFSSYLSLFTTVPQVSLGFFASLCLLLGPVVLAAALLLKKPSPQLAGAAMLLLAAGYLCQTGAVISNLFASEAEDWEITLYYTTPVLLDLFCAAALFFSALRMFTSKGRGARWTVLLAFGIVLVIWLGSALFSGVDMGLAPSTFSSPLLFLGLALFTPPFFTGKGTRWGLLPFTTGGVLIVVAALVLAFALNGTVSFSGGGGSDSGGSGSTCPGCAAAPTRTAPTRTASGGPTCATPASTTTRRWRTPWAVTWGHLRVTIGKTWNKGRPAGNRAALFCFIRGIG